MEPSGPTSQIEGEQDTPYRFLRLVTFRSISTFVLSPACPLILISVHLFAKQRSQLNHDGLTRSANVSWHNKCQIYGHCIRALENEERLLYVTKSVARRLILMSV